MQKDRSLWMEGVVISATLVVKNAAPPTHTQVARGTTGDVELEEVVEKPKKRRLKSLDAFRGYVNPQILFTSCFQYSNILVFIMSHSPKSLSLCIHTAQVNTILPLYSQVNSIHVLPVYYQVNSILPVYCQVNSILPVYSQVNSILLPVYYMYKLVYLVVGGLPSIIPKLEG